MSAARFDQSLQNTSMSGAPKTQVLTDGLGPGTVVSNQDLTGLDLSGLDLSGAVFLNASLADTSRSNCKLAGATLLRCILSGSSPLGASLTGADLREPSSTTQICEVPIWTGQTFGVSRRSRYLRAHWSLATKCGRTSSAARLVRDGRPRVATVLGRLFMDSASRPLGRTGMGTLGRNHSKSVS